MVAAVGEGLLQQSGIFEGVAELVLQVDKVLLAGTVGCCHDGVGMGRVLFTAA